MTQRAFIVTGSRALVGSTREPIARDLLASVLDSTTSDTVIVCGDAGGPDAWVVEHTRSGSKCPRAQHVWALDGWIYDEHRRRVLQWSSEANAQRDENPRRWPLIRNRLMIRGVAARAREGWLVDGIAIEAAWSRSKGTAHTLGVARDCGLLLMHVIIPAPLALRGGT